MIGKHREGSHDYHTGVNTGLSIITPHRLRTFCPLLTLICMSIKVVKLSELSPCVLRYFQYFPFWTYSILKYFLCRINLDLRPTILSTLFPWNTSFWFPVNFLQTAVMIFVAFLQSWLSTTPAKCRFPCCVFHVCSIDICLETNKKIEKHENKSQLRREIN